jgi:hypothetical protein
MTDGNIPDYYMERARFLATVKDIGEGTEVADAALDLMIRLESSIQSPWAVTDPFAAERYLVARGADPDVASEEGVVFEIQMRALVSIGLGRPVQSFSEIAGWIAEHVDTTP